MLTLAPECSIEHCPATVQRRTILVFCAVALVILFLLGGIKSRFYGVPFALAGFENSGIGLVCGLAGLGAGSLMAKNL